MVQASPPERDPSWWIRVAYILIGALISALIGWFSSLYNHYRDSRKHHLGELKRHVLDPLRAATLVPTLRPTFEVIWGPQTYNPNVGVSEYPVTHGPVLRMREPEITVDRDVEPSLLEDARGNHYPSLIPRWERFIAAVSKHSRDHREFVERLAEDILTSSGLPAHPSKERNGPYIMQLELALVVYGRLMKYGQAMLEVEDHPHEASYLTCSNTARWAKGQPAQIRGIVQRMDSLISTNRDRAAQLERELAALAHEQSTLVALLSYEIAARKLPGRCRLVPFWQL
jgi:hypothetical protein